MGAARKLKNGRPKICLPCLPSWLVKTTLTNQLACLIMTKSPLPVRLFNNSIMVIPGLPGYLLCKCTILIYICTFCLLMAMLECS